MKRHHTILVLLLAMIILGGSGCMAPSNNRTGGDINDIALAYLEEKYGEPFTYAGAAGNSMSGIRSFYASCESLPGKKVMVEIEHFRSDSRVIRDNFLLVKYQPEIEQLLIDCALTEFSEVKLFYKPNDVTLSPELPADASLEQVLADGHAYLNAMFEVHAGELQNPEQIKRAAMLAGADVPEYYFVFIAVGEDRFGTLSKEELENCISDKTYTRYAMYALMNGIEQELWREAGE